MLPELAILNGVNERNGVIKIETRQSGDILTAKPLSEITCLWTTGERYRVVVRGNVLSASSVPDTKVTNLSLSSVTERGERLSRESINY